MRNAIEVEAAFLRESSMVGRTQPHSTVTGVTMSEGAAQEQCVAGPSVTISTAVGARSAQPFSDATGPLVPTFAGETQSYPDDPIPGQLWSALLDDLGSYPGHLPHADPNRRLVRVHRDGWVAHGRVTNEARDRSYGPPLDRGEMPADLTVDITAAFRAASAPR